MSDDESQEVEIGEEEEEVVAEVGGVVKGDEKVKVVKEVDDDEESGEVDEFEESGVLKKVFEVLESRLFDGFEEYEELEEGGFIEVLEVDEESRIMGRIFAPDTRLGLKLPEEMLSKVFWYLDERELGFASGVCVRWYITAEHRLSRRHITLHRREMGVPKEYKVHLMLAGIETVKEVKCPLPKRISYLTILIDKPAEIKVDLLKRIIPSQLRQIEFINVCFKSSHIAAILLKQMMCVIFYLLQKTHISQKAWRILKHYYKMNIDDLYIMDSRSGGVFLQKSVIDENDR